jgi:hypothetical protein
MLKALLLCFVIFASLGIFVIGPHSALAVEQSPKEGNRPTLGAKDTDKLDTPDKKPECVRGMKALSRPFSEPCPF